MFPGLIDITSNPHYTHTASPCLCGSGLPRLMVSSGGEDETCKILAQDFDLAWSRREAEFFRDRWRHTIKA